MPPVMIVTCSVISLDPTMSGMVAQKWESSWSEMWPYQTCFFASGNCWFHGIPSTITFTGERNQALGLCYCIYDKNCNNNRCSYDNIFMLRDHFGNTETWKKMKILLLGAELQRNQVNYYQLFIFACCPIASTSKVLLLCHLSQHLPTQPHPEINLFQIAALLPKLHRESCQIKSIKKQLMSCYILLRTLERPHCLWWSALYTL